MKLQTRLYLHVGNFGILSIDEKGFIGSHVCCKERFNAETLSGRSLDEQFNDAQVRDDTMIWLDGLGSNTT
jgi:hypothetical protein